MNNKETLSEQAFSLPVMVERDNKNTESPYADYEKAYVDGKEFSLYYPSREEFLKKLPSEKYLDAGLVLISNNNIYMYNIPTKYQPFVVFNEAYCEKVLEEKWLCAKMLEKELELVDEKMLKEFLMWRLNFFRGMYTLYTDEDHIILVSWTQEKMSEAKDFCWKYAQEMKLCIEVIENFMKKDICNHFAYQTSEVLQN